jgi:hypothetical protein
VNDPGAPSELKAGTLITLVATAFNEHEKDVVDNIARMAKPPKGGDSDPTRETILSYIKPAKPKLTGEDKSARRNRETPVHYKLAHLVTNYLDGRRADEKHIEVPATVTGSEVWKQASSFCNSVLCREREKRFERPLGSDPNMEATVTLVAGVYAVCRRESSDGKYHQELLILRNIGSRDNPRCYCTFVTDRVVSRGEWTLTGNIIYCGLSGFLADNTHEIGGLYLAHTSGHDLLSGFLAGAGTDVRYPVAMPLVAVKITDPDESVRNLGDLGDEAILRLFRKLKIDLDHLRQRLEHIFNKQMTPVTFHASTCNSELRNEFNGGRELVDERFQEFCRQPVSS